MMRTFMCILFFALQSISFAAKNGQNAESENFVSKSLLERRIQNTVLQFRSNMPRSNKAAGIEQLEPLKLQDKNVTLVNHLARLDVTVSEVLLTSLSKYHLLGTKVSEDLKRAWVDVSLPLMFMYGHYSCRLHRQKISEGDFIARVYHTRVNVVLALQPSTKADNSTVDVNSTVIEVEKLTASVSDTDFQLENLPGGRTTSMALVSLLGSVQNLNLKERYKSEVVTQAIKALQFTFDSQQLQNLYLRNNWFHLPQK